MGSNDNYLSIRGVLVGLEPQNKRNFSEGNKANAAINIQKEKNEATIYLYDEIHWLFGIDAQEFVKELNQITADTIHLRINSPGGVVYDGRAIQTALKQHPAKIIAHIDGVSASAATTVMLGADEIEMADGAFLMIHGAAAFLDILGYFSAGEMKSLLGDIEESIERLVKIDEAIIKDYAKKTGKTESEITAVMTNKDGKPKDAWFTAQEALDFGLIDRIYDGEPVENKWDFSMYENAPETLKQPSEACEMQEDGGTPPKPRTAEDALRDVGYSRREAKAILSGGLKAIKGQKEDVEPAPEEEGQPNVAALFRQRDDDYCETELQLLGY